MDKKGNIYTMLWPIWVMVIGMIILSLISVFVIEPNKDEACQDIGFEKFKNTGDLNYCIDNEGNYHFVEWGYEGFPDVYVKEISIGDIVFLDSYMTFI